MAVHSPLSRSVGPTMDRQTSPDAPLAVGGNSPGDGLPDGPGMPVPPPGRPTAAIPPVQNAQPSVPPPAQPAAAQPVSPAAPATPQPPAQPAPPPMQLPQPAVPGVAQPPAKTASPLVDAFIARCRELGMSDEEVYVTAKTAAAMDPLLAEEFEKAAMPPLVAAALPWLGGLALRGLGRVGSLFGGSVGRAGASATARGASLSAKAKTIAARNTPAAAAAPASAAAPATASAAATAPASAATTPVTTGTWPSMTSGSKPTPAPTPAGPSLSRQLLVGAAPMGLMVGAPMAVEGVHARREATKQKNELEQASQLALASTQGDPHMYSAFAQQHNLAPHATEAMTRIMNVPEFRAMLTDQHRAGQFMAQLKHFSEMPGMTAETLSHMMANQLEAGAVVKEAATKDEIARALVRGLFESGTLLNGRPYGQHRLPGLPRSSSPTRAQRFGAIDRLIERLPDVRFRGAAQPAAASPTKVQAVLQSEKVTPSGNPEGNSRSPLTTRDDDSVPTAKTESSYIHSEPGALPKINWPLRTEKGLPRRARPTGAPADNLKPPQVDGAETAGPSRLSRLLELRHSPYVKWPALFGAGAATPSVADYVFGGESAQERAFTPLSAEPPSPAEGVKRTLPEPRVVKESAVKSAQPPATAAPTPPEPAQPEQPGVMGQIGNTLGQAGNALSGFWSGLDPVAKATTGIGGGLLAGSALHGLTGVGPGLGAIGPLAGLGLTGYGLYRGGHLDGLIGSLRKLIGLDKDHDGTPDQQEAASPAAAVGGPSKQLAAFRRNALTPKRAPVTGTTPAPTVAGGGLTLQQAATHPQFSKYFANGQLNKDALISASDADLTTAVRALHPDARGTLRQQVAAYQPNYIERTFGGADRHKARFQAILEKAGGISMLPRLRKAWQRGVSGVAASRFGQFMGKHPVAGGLGVAGGAVAVPLAVDLAGGQAIGSRLDSEAQKGQRRMYDALDTLGLPLKPRGAFDETRPVEEFRDALDLQPKEGAAQASVKVGADSPYWSPVGAVPVADRYKDVLLPTEAPGARIPKVQLSQRDFDRMIRMRRLFADPTLHPSDRRKAEATLDRFEPGQTVPQLPSPRLPRVIPSLNMYDMPDPYSPGSAMWTVREEDERFALRRGIPKADLDRLDLLRAMEVARNTPYRDRMDVRQEAESYTQAGWPKSPEPYEDYTGGKAGPTDSPAGFSRPAGDAQPNKSEEPGGAGENSAPSSSFVGRNWPYLVGGAGLLGLGAYGLHRLFRTKDKEEDDESQLPYTGLSAKKKASVRAATCHWPR